MNSDRCFECGCKSKELVLYKGEYVEPELMCEECIRIISQMLDQEEFCATYGINHWEAPWT